MDTIDNDCTCCCIEFPQAGKQVICACGYKTCDKCVKRYILDKVALPHCMSCKNKFNMNFLVAHLTKTYMTKTYRQHRKTVLFNGEKARFEETMQDVIEIKRKRQFNFKVEPFQKQKSVIQNQINTINKLIRTPDQKIKATIRYNSAYLENDKQVLRLRYSRIWSNWEPMAGVEMTKMMAEVTELKKSKAPLLLDKKAFVSQIKAIKLEFYPRVERPNQTEQLGVKPKNKKKFTQKCAVPDCEGFLSTKWKCELCETKTCAQCLEVKDELHVCDPNTVATVKLIKKDTRNCPGCGMAIHRISGCTQMWCTQCHIAFDYKTGQKANGPIHNPHFFQWARETGQLPERRNGRAAVCGQRLGEIIPMNKISSNYKEKVRTLYRLSLHFQDTVITRARTNTHGEADNLDLRIMFMMKDRTEAKIKTTLIMRDNKRNKEIDFIQIYEFLCTLMIEAIYSLSKDQSDENVQKALDDVENARVYCNKQLRETSKAYGHKPKEITNTFNVEYIKTPLASQRMTTTTITPNFQ